MAQHKASRRRAPRGMLSPFSPSGMRGWRAERRKPYGVRVHRWTRRAPSGAPQRRLIRHRAPLSIGLAALEANARPSRQAAPAGGPYWPRGGAPMWPECKPCEGLPAGAAPRPTSRRLMNAPLGGRGDASLTARGKAGIRPGIGPLKFTRHPRACPGGPIGR